MFALSLTCPTLFTLPSTPQWTPSLVGTVVNKRSCRGQEWKQDDSNARCSSGQDDSWLSQQLAHVHAAIRTAVEQRLTCMPDIETTIERFGIFSARRFSDAPDAKATLQMPGRRGSDVSPYPRSLSLRHEGSRARGPWRPQ